MLHASGKTLLPVHTLFDVLADHPAIIRAMRSEFAIDQAAIAQDFLDARQFNAYISWIEQQGVTDIGFRLGLVQTLSSFGTLGYLLQACSNLREAINFYGHYQPRQTRVGGSSQFQLKGAQLFINVRINPALEQSRDAAESFVIGKFFAIFSQICGFSWRPTKIYWRNDNCPFANLASNRLGIKVELNHQQSGLCFDASWLDRALPGQNSKIKSLLHTELDKEIRSLLANETPLDKVIAILSQELDPTELSAESIAIRLKVSERTLNRQLKECGTSFKELANSYKNRRAIELLSADHDIGEVTQQLGFSDRSSFERAFKGWLGITPAQFREQHQKLLGENNQYQFSDPETLPSLSPVGMEVLEIINSGEYDIDQLANTIKHDTVLTAKLIGLATTAFYGAFKITTLEEAIVKVFGVDLVRNLAIALITNGTFEKIVFPKFESSEHWIQQFTVSELAAAIAKRFPQAFNVPADDLYLCGLMQNIGYLFLIHTQKDAMLKVMKELDANHYSVTGLAEKERQLVGIDHFHATALLLSHWGVPNQIVKTIRPVDLNQLGRQGPQWKSCRLLRVLNEISVQIWRSNRIDPYPFRILAKALDLDDTGVLACMEAFADDYDQLKSSTREIFS